MNRILGKELSAYMNKISWATVWVQEVERLKQQVPNLSMWDEEFKQAVEDYNNTIEDTKFSYKNIYWLWDQFRSQKNTQQDSQQPEVFQSTLRY